MKSHFFVLSLTLFSLHSMSAQAAPNDYEIYRRVDDVLTPLIKYADDFAGADLGALNGPVAELGSDLNKYGKHYAYAGLTDTLTCKVVVNQKLKKAEYIDREAKYCMNHPESQSSIKAYENEKEPITSNYPSVLKKSRELVADKINQIRYGRDIKIISLNLALNRFDYFPSILEFKFSIQEFKLQRRSEHWKCRMIYSQDTGKFRHLSCHTYENRAGEI